MLYAEILTSASSRLVQGADVPHSLHHVSGAGLALKRGPAWEFKKKGSGHRFGFLLGTSAILDESFSRQPAVQLGLNINSGKQGEWVLAIS